jgi:hypothetical protein
MKLLTAIMVVALCSAPAVRVSNAQAASSTSNAAVSWLEPSDAMFAKAIDDGFSGKKLAKDARYHTYLNWIKPAVDSRIEVHPPIFCAVQVGQAAHDKLESKPDLESVKKLCLGWVTVTLVHYSQSLSANWPCVFQKGDLTLQPLVKVPDHNPQVANFYGGFLAGDVVGYRYVDTYSFQFPLTLIDGASMVYADETGQHHTLAYDFSVFSKDVPRSEGLPSAQAPVLPEATKQAMLTNSETGKSSPAAAAALADAGHVLTPEEMAGQVQAGQASKCAVITNPPGAEIYVDGNKAGLSPMVFVLLKKGDTPRIVTIKMGGYKTVEKRVIPDGNIIPLGLTLEKEPQEQ